MHSILCARHCSRHLRYSSEQYRGKSNNFCTLLAYVLAWQVNYPVGKEAVSTRKEQSEAEVRNTCVCWWGWGDVRTGKVGINRLRCVAWPGGCSSGESVNSQLTGTAPCLLHFFPFLFLISDSWYFPSSLLTLSVFSSPLTFSYLYSIFIVFLLSFFLSSTPLSHSLLFSFGFLLLPHVSLPSFHPVPPKPWVREWSEVGRWRNLLWGKPFPVGKPYHLACFQDNDIQSNFRSIFFLRNFTSSK